jgi:hypothetical protein
MNNQKDNSEKWNLCDFNWLLEGMLEVRGGDGYHQRHQGNL